MQSIFRMFHTHIGSSFEVVHHLNLKVKNNNVKNNVENIDVEMMTTDL